MTRVNVNKELLEEIINEFPYRTVFSNIVVTTNSNDEDVLLPPEDSTLSEMQYVVSAPPNSIVKAGDRVMLDMNRLITYERVERDNAYETIPKVKINPVYYKDIMFNVIDDRMILMIEK